MSGTFNGKITRNGITELHSVVVIKNEEILKIRLSLLSCFLAFELEVVNLRVS
jgi:hypothetical protein